MDYAFRRARKSDEMKKGGEKKRMCGIKQQGETKQERYIKCKIKNGIITLGSQELKGVKSYQLIAGTDTLYDFNGTT